MRMRKPESKGYRLTKGRQAMLDSGMTIEQILGMDKTVKLNTTEPMANGNPIGDGRTDAEIYSDINTRFSALDTMVHATINGLNRSMVISAAPGIGKSFGVMKALNDSNCKYQLVKGYITPPQLYLALYNNRNPGDVLCIDDADNIYDSENSMNLIKACCDSSDVREVSWLSSRDIMTEDGEAVPKTFTFDGSVIFITNKNFNEEIKRQGKMAPHFEALRSRSHYISLGVNTKREYLVRIRQVVDSTNILEGFNTTEKQEILSFIEDHKDKLIELSLRIVNKISNLVLISPDGWKDIAKISLMA